jgi:hypothetical protein
LVFTHAVHGIPAATATTLTKAWALKGTTSTGVVLAAMKTSVPVLCSVLLSPFMTALASYFGIRATVNVSKTPSERAARLRFGMKLGFATLMLAAFTSAPALLNPARHPGWFVASLFAAILFTLAYVGLVVLWSLRHQRELSHCHAEGIPNPSRDSIVPQPRTPQRRLFRKN